MKKIPTLFERTFGKHKVSSINPKVTPGCEPIMNGEGVATIKIDGACCAIIGGKLYKRYDAKGRKKVPAGSFPCGDPDPVTGHWPHWAPVLEDNPSDKWFIEALKNRRDADGCDPVDATYEAIGRHFNGNPYHLDTDIIVRHGRAPAIMPRTFEGIRGWLEEHNEEGLVFWMNGEPLCKIKRTDFGLEWPIKR